MLGQELLKAFSKNNNELIAWDKENLDITKKEQVAEKIINLKPDLIINSAAYNDVDGCEKNFEFAKLLNGYAVGYLANAADKLDIPVVHFSTGYVFDGEKGNYSEDMAPNPISKYAESKLLGEEELKKATQRFYLIRTNLLFGNPGLAENSKKSFVELMLGLIKAKNKLQIINDEVSNPTYVKDLAEAAYELVSNNYPFGIYHLINDGNASWYDWAKEIFKIRNLAVEIEAVGADKFPRDARRPRNSSLLNTKFPKLRSWQNALNEYLKNE